LRKERQGKGVLMRKRKGEMERGREEKKIERE
jgi:hypothetical protein